MIKLEISSDCLTDKVGVLGPRKLKHDGEIMGWGHVLNPYRGWKFKPIRNAAGQCIWPTAVWGDPDLLATGGEIRVCHCSLSAE